MIQVDAEKGVLKINLQEFKPDGYLLEIFDLSGNLLFRKEIKDVHEVTSIPKLELPRRKTYIAKINTGESSIYQQFLFS
jgi:hypothetical protein